MRDTGAQVSAGPLPPGLLVEAPRPALERTFGALCPLQPVEWADEGLVCAPRAAPEAAAAALAACPLPTRRLAEVPGWPDPPAALLAGWYRRSPAHAPAPAGIGELVQVPGEGFGPGDHPTTAMCLAAIGRLPPGPALDAGCGSGLLAQAWARLGRGPVDAWDLDPRARSLAAAGLAELVSLRRGPLEALPPGLIAGRVVLANVPASAHRALIARTREPPRAVLASGLRPAEAAPVVAAWRARGLRPAAAARRGGFVCWTLVA
jgi:SAM-dependent methyltransferase